MFTFKLLGGTFDQGDKMPDGKPKLYSRGDTVQSEKELDKIHGPHKFQRIDPGETTVVAVEDTFSAMTKDELLKFAEEEEIDLGGAKRKDDILAAIRSVVS